MVRKLPIFLDKGDHSVGFYPNRKRKLEMSVSYLRAGLALKEKCILVGTESDFQEIHKTMMSFKISGYSAKTIDYVDSKVYLTAMGKDDFLSLCSQWVQMIEDYLAKGFSAVRGVGSLPDGTELTEKTASFLLKYEESLHSLFEQYPLSAMCLYPSSFQKTRFGEKIAHKKYHPISLMTLRS